MPLSSFLRGAGHPSFRSAYVLALLLLAALRLGGYLNLDHAITARAHDAAIMNVAGRQRMLSQRVVSLAQQLTTVTLMTQEQKRAALLGAASEMRRAQADLSDPASSLRRGVALSPALRALYLDSPDPLNAQVSRYLRGVQAIASAGAPFSPDALGALLAESETLLPRLDMAAKLTEAQSAALLRRAHDLDALGLFTTLLALLATGLWLFRPAERRGARLLGELEEQRSFLSAVLGSLSEGLAVCDPQGRLVLFRGANGSGPPAENLRPEEWADVFHLYRPDGVTPMPFQEMPLYRALHGEMVRAEELSVAPPGAGTRFLLANASPVRGERGEQLGAVAVMRDISARKKLERELRAERDFARSVLDHMGEGLALTDHEARYTYVNLAFARLLGRPPAELIGLTPRDVTSPDAHAAVARQQAAPATAHEQMDFVRADGERVPALVTAAPFQRETGFPGALAVITDLTERMATERELREREARYRTLAANFPQGAVVLFNEELRYLLADGAGLAAAGLTRERMEGRTVYEIFAPEVAEIIAPDHLAALDGESSTRELTFFGRSYLIHTFPAGQGGASAARCGTVIVQDVSDLARARRNLEAQASEMALIAQQAETARRAAETLADLSRRLEGAHTSGDVARGAFELLSGALSIPWLALVQWQAGEITVVARHGEAPWDAVLKALNPPWGAVNTPSYLSVGGRDLGSVAYVPLPDKPGRAPTWLVAAREPGAAPSWSPEQRTVLEAAARAVCGAWARVALGEELRHAAEHATALSAVSQLTEGDLTPEEVALRASQIVARCAGMDWGGLAVVRGDHADMFTAWSSPAVSAALHAQVAAGFRRGQGLLWSALERGEALYVDDYPAQVTAHPTLLQEGVRAGAWVPLVSFEGASYLFSGMRLYKAPWTERDKALIGAAARSVNIATLRREHLHALEAAALGDKLTGLANRRAFDLALEQLRAGPHSVLVIDLDGLKAVNDREGHERGDALIATFAANLRAVLRREDQVFRLGGDEYAVLSAHANSAGLAVREGLEGRVREAVRLTREAGFERVDASAGSASYPTDVSAPSELLRVADERMYAQKRERKELRAAQRV